MKIYQLLHELVERFAPMDEMTKVKLKDDAATAYAKAVEKAKSKETFNRDAVNDNERRKNEADYVPIPLEKYTLQEKVMLFCEQWYVGYINALLFVFLVPKIKAYFNGESSSEDDGEDENTDLQDFMEFKRFKKSNA